MSWQRPDTCTNTINAFDVTVDLISVKSLAEAIEISTAGIRKQFDAFAAQSQELGAVSYQMMTETIEPISRSLPSVSDAGAALTGVTLAQNQ
jgi:hypothetical protein